MPKMLVSNVGETKTERLVGYTDLTRSIKVNDLNSISFTVVRNEVNAAAFDLLEDDSPIEYDGVRYIADVEKRPYKNTTKAVISTQHEFFSKMIDRSYVYTTLPTASRSLSAYMSFITQDSDYTFSVIDSFESKEIENFGGANPLDLFKKLLDTFKAEFDVVGNEIRLYSHIGPTQGYPFRSRHNISDIVKKGSAKNLCTYIRGFGKPYEDQNILKGESLNFQERSSGWDDTTDPYWWTDEVGRTFTMKWNGTGIRFWYLQSPDGGVWEFQLDGDQTATLSTWGKTAGLKSVNLFMDAPEQDHVIVATFKGDDENHVPSTGAGKSRGWVRRSDTENLKTFEVYTTRKGDAQYMAVAEYTSPLAAKYGIRHQDPIYDERFTNPDYLTSYLRENLNDKLDISYEMSFRDLSKAGYPTPKPIIGASVPFIVEELNLTIPDVRIMEITEYPEADKDPDITLGNSRETYGEAAFNTSKQLLDDLFDSKTNRIKPSMLDEATKRFAKAINNSLSQVEYPVNMGIVLRDPNDANKIVVLRSSGIGISQNNGEDYVTAMTAEGIVADVIYTGQLNTNNVQIVGDEALFYIDGTEFRAIDPTNPNKYIRITPGQMYISRGAMTIERPDGFKLIQDGYANFDFNVQFAMPAVLSNGVYQEGRWYKTMNTEKGDAGYYSFQHTSRFLYLQLAFYADDGGGGYIFVDGSGATSGTTYASFHTNHSIGNVYADTGRIFVVDLGVPDGGQKSVYVRIQSDDATKNVSVRHIRGYLRD
ncbi:prophage endopeptidase tail family protein [Priestia aryabhattai]|uniref:prophage endopeptidase tail family protein n=1 Tax=Priestia aryabhattai TaxID=412384 RepID=UPI0035AB9B8D